MCMLYYYGGQELMLDFKQQPYNTLIYMKVRYGILRVECELVLVTLEIHQDPERLEQVQDLEFDSLV